MKQLQFKNTFQDDSFFNIARINPDPDPGVPATYEPHSHDYYVIIVITSGEGMHKIDFNAYPIRPGSIFFISPHQVHQVVEEDTHQGFVIAFNREFLIHSNISKHFLDHINLFRQYGESPPLSPAAEVMGSLVKHCTEMERCFRERSEFRYQALGSYLKLFLIECHAICELSGSHVNQTLDNAISTISAFKDMVEEKITIWHKASQYAEALHISPNYLNKLNREYMNTSTKEYLQNRLVLAAKRRLLTSPASVKEIAYDLGFQDPSHLSKMFRTCTGTSISEFRASLKA
ncbi:helix-turn-helix domain-containing protein [Robertkochia flava]|uniref:helix-turn-helix domain-containing protein n=1 Tax=Robertkochia flava TaxID=3447986 RepID=UPI001CCF0192|nr:AraC family transcriptional regulator [Robertkochia marina]